MSEPVSQIPNTPPENNPYMTPPPGAQHQPPQARYNQGDETGGVIPYKNPCALIAYYLGLFSLFPLLGFFLAVPAFVLGIMGLRARKANPVIKGSVHAWIGIVMGGLFSIIWGLMIVAFIMAMVARPMA